MNKVITHTVVFILGATVSFLVTKKVYEKKYAQIAEEEIASVRESYDRRRQQEEWIRKQRESDTQKIVLNANPALMEAISCDKNNPNGAIVRNRIENPYEKAKKNYNLIKPVVTETGDIEPSDPPEDEEGAEEVEDDEEIRDSAGLTESEHKLMRSVGRKAPYMINDEEYSNDCPNNDKVSLYYYKVDNTLCEESEEIIDDPVGAIGKDALNALQTRMNVWVRNERLGIDYEILGLNTSYKETVAGMREEAAMTPRERYEKKQREKNGRE